MNLRSVRVQLTLLFAAMTALAVAAISWFAVSQGQQGIYDSAERDAEKVLKDLAIAQINGGSTDASNTWDVWVNDDWQDWSAIADSWVEPPLYSIVNSTREWPGFYRFDYNGPWLAYSEPVTEGHWVVTAVDLAEYEADASKLRWRVVLAALASILVTSGVGYLLAGRSLRPAKLAMAQQRDFIADAAHELRTPLAVIQASAGHALARPRSDEEYRASLEEIHGATSRAGASVSELLELARLDAGQAQPRLAPLRADLLVEEVAASIKVDGTQVHARVEQPIVVEADYALLRQVLDTLVRNSTARAQVVEIAAYSVGGNCTVVVRDDGPGFDPSVLPHVFDRFRRGDALGSSGLGMAIAKKIVESHRGTISAANLGADDARTGAAVTIDLPIA